MRSCKSCGCVNDNINRYCRNCGSSLENKEIKIPSAPAVPEEAPVSPLLPIEEPEAIPAEAEKDFFDLTPARSEENTLFGMMPPAEDEAELGYIDFDLGEDAQSAPAESAPQSPRDKLREVTASPVFMIFAILASVGFVLSAGQFVLGFRSGSDSFSVMLSELISALFILGFERIGAYGIAVYAAPVAVLVRVCALLPAALYIIGVWTYFGGMMRSKSKTASVGLSFISAGTVVTLILCSVGLLLCGIYGMGVLLSVFGSSSEILPELLGALVLIGAIGVGVLIAVIYNCFALGTLSRLKRTVRTGIADHRLSVFVMVVNLIAAVGISAQSGFHLAGRDFVSFALAFVNMLTFAVLTLFMAKCRVELKENI